MHCPVRVGFLVLVLLFGVAEVSGRSLRLSETGRIRVLYVGAVGSRAFRHALSDPFFEVTPVAAAPYRFDEEVVQRAVRRYMPRTYTDLVGEVDVVALHYANRHAFSLQMVGWLSDGVVRGGLGLSFMGFRPPLFGDWLTSNLGEVLPLVVCGGDVVRDVRIRVCEAEHPLMASLPLQSMGRHGVLPGYTPVKAKEGSVVLYDLVPLVGSPNPGGVWWDVGDGRVVAHSGAFGERFLVWEFLPDWTSNWLLFLAGAEIPQDPVMMHGIRQCLWEYRFAHGLLISMIEFVDKVGGNPLALENVLRDAEADYRAVGQMYLDHEFEGCLGLVTQLLKDLSDAYELAVRVKNRSLLWIHIAEWAVMTGTGLLTGGVVWTLMVKKRLYKETQATRLNGTHWN